MLQALQQTGSLTFLLALVQDAICGDLPSEKNVLRNVQVRAQVQLLVNDPNAVRIGVTDRPELNLRAIEEERAAGGLCDACQNLHQRRLPGSVLTD